MLITVALGAAACDDPSSDGDGGGLQPTYAWLQEHIFTDTCALPACHSSVQRSGDLILEPDMSYDMLVGPVASNPDASSEGMLRVQPGEPDASFLWHKLQLGVEPRYGALMPSGTTSGLGPDKLDAIRMWIEDGAEND